VYIFLIISTSIFPGYVRAQTRFAFGERTVALGGNSAWANVDKRTGITEAGNIRPVSVLLLTSGTNVSGISESSSALDMAFSFDEREVRLFHDRTGNYRIRAPLNQNAGTAGRDFARVGAGAALFGNAGPLFIEPQSRNALFTQDNFIGCFTIEFWLFPMNMENGERVFGWAASGRERSSAQRIAGVVTRNRLHWSFVNFFSPQTIEFTSRSPIIPRTWSHHLIRFDSVTGMIEYIVDGVSEAIVYATRTGRESSEVFIPHVAANGIFTLGENFSGLMDELKIHRGFVSGTSTQRYHPSGGRIETRPIDLGDIQSSVVRVDVTGGRTGNRGGVPVNEFRDNGIFRFADDSQMHFFVRSSNNQWLLDNSRWISFTPGSPITGIEGRFVQIAVDFYPSADGEVSPYLEGLRIIYLPGEPVMPPRNVIATAVDGGVYLRWRSSASANVAGYLVYYSSVQGELFGTGADLGASPIHVGLTNSVFIDGLRNGTLYFFRIAGYDRIIDGNFNSGEFSAEVTARPLAGLLR